MTANTVCEQLLALKGVVKRTNWFHLNQQQFNQFCQLTGDQQFIHTQPTLAASTPYQSTIAPGYFLLSLFGGALTELLPLDYTDLLGLNYGLDRVRFIRPVKVNQPIAICATLIDISSHRTGGALCKLQMSVIVEPDQAAVSAQWLFLVREYSSPRKEHHE
jgi:acyl dehydratase